MLNEPRSGTDLSQCLILQRSKSLVGYNILIYLAKYDDKIVIRFFLLLMHDSVQEKTFIEILVNIIMISHQDSSSEMCLRIICNDDYKCNNFN